MTYRAGFIGVVGKPNAGKSTLVNALVGEKISIVSAKPQTTRRRIQGIVTEPEFQAVFVDAPGVIKKTSGLNKFLHEEYQDVVKGADALCVVFNIDESQPEYADELIMWAKSTKKKWMAVVSKVDLPQVHRVGILRAKLEAAGVPTVGVSALKDTKMARELILEKVKDLLPESPAPLFGDEDFTTESVRDLCAEIIREKCFEFLHQEIPYGLAVQIRAFDESSPTLTKIYADIMLERDNHKGIVIGQGGRTLQLIGKAAREEIEKLVDTKVFLENRIVVKPKWVQNTFVMRELGYVLNR